MRLGMAYVPAHLPDHQEQDYAEILDAGCEEVLVALSETDFHVRTGVLQQAAKAASRMGLRPWVNFWGLGCVFGGGRVSRLLSDEPEVMILDPGGSRKGQACLNHPAFRKRVREMADKAAEAGFKGFFWDEPTETPCVCGHCVAAANKLMGSDLDKKAPESVKSLAQATAAGYVQEMSDYMKGLSPSFLTSACVMPQDQEVWRRTLKTRNLDSLGTDPYWLLFGQTAAQGLEDARRMTAESRAAGHSPHLWVQCWNIPRDKEETIYETAQAFASAGPDSLWAWSFRGGEGTNEACADPARSWAALVRAFREIKTG